MQAIIAAREKGGPFFDLFDFCERIDRKVVNRRAVEALVRAGAFDALDADRAKLLANVVRAMEAGEQKDRAKAAGQSALFGDFDVAAGSAADGSTPALPVREWVATAPWDETRRLLEEKAALGLYLSGHLFSPHEAELRRFVKTRLADLGRIVENSYGAQQVTVAGVIVAISTMMTRRGRMTRVMLDDRSGPQELAVFSEQFEQNRALLKEDALVVVHAKVSKDEYSGGFRFTAERLLDLATARAEHARSLQLSMNGQSDARRLASLLENYRADGPDDCGLPIEIEYHNDNANVRMRLGAAWAVRPADDLLAQLRDWLTPEAVRLTYR